MPPPNEMNLIFPEADRFDVGRRNARRHLGFGAVIHMCAAMHLAILEIECLIHAIAARSPKFEIGEPRIAMNNSICAFSELPIKALC